MIPAPVYTPGSSWLSRRSLLTLLIAASIWHIAFFIIVASLRVFFPMQLEWVESGVLDTVARVLSHHAIYVAPTHLFVPYLYTPLYFHVSALVCHLFGLGFTPLRSLSIVCALGCFALIFEQVREFTGSRLAGLLATGCFAALYGAAGASFDLARVDMLYVLLTLAAVYAFWRDQALFSGLLFACAYQSKQGVGIIAVCVFLGAWRRPRQGAIGMVTFLALTLGSVLLFNHASGGWYDFYTLWLPSHQPLDRLGLLYFVARDIGRYLLPGLLLILWNAPRNLRQISHSHRASLLLSCTVGSFLTSFAGRIHSGGGANAILPFYAWFAVLFGVAIERQFARQEAPLTGRMNLVSTLAVIQLLITLTLPSRFVPSAQANQEAHQFMTQIAAVPGDILIIDAAADLSPTPKRSFANGITVWDLIRAGDSPASRSLVADLQESFAQRRYAALLSPYSPINGQITFGGSPVNLSRYYRLDTPPLFKGDVARSLRIIETPNIGPAYLFPVRR